VSVGIGIDFGEHSVTAAAIRRRGGNLSLERYLHIPLAELHAEGVDTSSPRQVTHALVARMSAADFRAKRAVLGVSGRDSIIRYSHLPPMPEWRVALLMDFEINDVAEKTGEPLSADFRAVTADDGGSLVIIALAKDARVKESVDHLEAAGVEAGGALPQPVALGECYRFLGEEAGVGLTLVVDVGRRSTQIAILDTGELIFARSVARGGDMITERLERLLGVDAETAEEVKLSGRTPDGDPIEELTGPAVQQLVSTLAASLDFARGQLKRRKLTVDRAVVTGGGGRLPGLAEALGESVGCEAQVFDPLKWIDSDSAPRATRDAAEEFGCEGATAVGLALSAAVPGAVQLNLLPNSHKEKLEFRHRTLWVYVSAVALAASVLVALSVSLWSRSSQDSRLDGIKQVASGVQDRTANHDALRANNDMRDQELAALADRAQPGLHLASLLARIGDALPGQITLTELKLVRERDEETFRFEMRGEADNAQSTGVDAMRELELALGSDPRVAQAQVQPLQTEGAMLEFKVTVIPVGGSSESAGEDG
jgi:type IV pilus assembly protein PilM